MKRPNRAPGTTWSLRRDFKDWVRTAENDWIHLRVGGQFLELSRPDARLLAKRLTQCLDATRLS